MKILEVSQVSEARRLTSYAAAAMGFNESDKGRISIIVTELVNNLIKHTKSGGEYHLYRIIDGGLEGLEMLTIDKGPGIRSISEAMRDGYSTAGSPGTGLGSVNRMSDFFDIYSAVDQGTVILSRIWLKHKEHSHKRDGFEIFTINLPKNGEEVSGDSWTCIQEPEKVKIIVADGLGHGPDAAAASREAVEAFKALQKQSLVETMEKIHLRLKSTRGAAISLLEIDAEKNVVNYCGVGNISGALISQDGNKSMVSVNGTVGHELRKVKFFSYPWQNDTILIMHSDGLATRWNLDKYPGLLFKSLSIVCGVLYRDFSRGNDDITILALRKR